MAIDYISFNTGKIEELLNRSGLSPNALYFTDEGLVYKGNLLMSVVKVFNTCSSHRNSIALNGQLLFKDSLHKLFMWLAIILQSFWVKFLNVVFLGKTYLINSWFFSIPPFCQEAEGSQ